MLHQPQHDPPEPLGAGISLEPANIPAALPQAGQLQQLPEKGLFLRLQQHAKGMGIRADAQSGIEGDIHAGAQRRPRRGLRRGPLQGIEPHQSGDGVQAYFAHALASFIGYQVFQESLPDIAVAHAVNLRYAICIILPADIVELIHITVRLPIKIGTERLQQLLIRVIFPLRLEKAQLVGGHHVCQHAVGMPVPVLLRQLLFMEVRPGLPVYVFMLRPQMVLHAPFFPLAENSGQVFRQVHRFRDGDMNLFQGGIAVLVMMLPPALHAVLGEEQADVCLAAQDGDSVQVRGNSGLLFIFI